MDLRVTVDLVARCSRCGAERDVPDGTAERVLEDVATSELVADTTEPCACGDTRIRVVVRVRA